MSTFIPGPDASRRLPANGQLQPTVYSHETVPTQLPWGTRKRTRPARYPSIGRAVGIADHLIRQFQHPGHLGVGRGSGRKQWTR